MREPWSTSPKFSAAHQHTLEAHRRVYHSTLGLRVTSTRFGVTTRTNKSLNPKRVHTNSPFQHTLGGQPLFVHSVLSAGHAEGAGLC